MDFEDFEGFKRIKNDKELELSDIYELLLNYKEQFNGNIGKFEDKIRIDPYYKYYIEITVGNFILIERKLDDMHNQASDTIEDDSVTSAKVNRLIEQIYDLINDYIKNGKVTEHITSCVETLFMHQEYKSGTVKLLDHINRMYIVSTENAEVLYKVEESKLFKKFVLKNSTEAEILNIHYNKIKDKEYKENEENEKYEFEIICNGYNKILLKVDETSEIKKKYKGMYNNKELKISMNYTERHALIELDEIVIGAVDCVNDKMDIKLEKAIDLNTDYRIEVNNKDYESLIVAIAVILDFVDEKDVRDIQKANDKEIKEGKKIIKKYNK